VSDGVISSVDVAARRSYQPLPAGVLVGTVDLASVRGTFVADYTFWGGRHVSSPRLTLEAGRIREIETADREDTLYLRELLAGASGDAGALAGVSFGLNPAGRGPTGKTMLDTCLEGTITLQFGNNELLGGRLRSTLNLAFPHTTVSARSHRHELLHAGAFVWEQSSTGPPRTGRYERSGIGAADVERIAQELLAYLESARTYRDPTLRQRDVARALSVSPAHLSQALHQAIGSTFHDLIARCRTEEFRRRIADPANAGKSHLALAQESGFASKASFYRIFKRETGLTPAEYQERRLRGDDRPG
jgi:AraC-like DNA-binding protein